MQTSGFFTTNPATGEILHQYSYLTSAQVEERVAEAFRHYQLNCSKPLATRKQELMGLAAGLRASSAQLSHLISLEMGKPVSEALAEIEKSAITCEFFADNLQVFLAAQEMASPYRRATVVKDPLGPILAIMPWNFPVWQVIRFAAPAVGIGNPVLLKHSLLTAGVALRLEQIFKSVGEGLLFHLPIDHAQAGLLLADTRVRGVTLTGSTAAGRAVAEVAGKNLKKSVLELGGSDAYIIFADSDLARAAEVCARARMVNNGQSCIAAKRFLVEKSVLPEFITLFESALRTYKRGNPLRPETQVGPLAAQRFQKSLLVQCEKLEAGGARKLFDFAEQEAFDEAQAGAFFPARAYQVDRRQALALNDEFFGPVALISEFVGEAEAVFLCNQSPYGLGAGLFTRDENRAERLARQIEAGFVAMNEQVKSDARLPFGGVKDSGYGRELGLFGFHEFCNIKTLGFA